jgi:hypothetical protein
MIDLKTIAGGLVIAGSLGFATLGIGAGLANAEPSPGAPQVTSVQPADASQGDGQTPPVAPPSPYAAYGGPSICATPGLYFVNICT